MEIAVCIANLFFLLLNSSEVVSLAGGALSWMGTALPSGHGTGERWSKYLAVLFLYFLHVAIVLQSTS